MAKVVILNLTAPPAIRDLTLEFPDRETTVILGAPGSGKTAILRLLAGLERPASGQILVGERAVENLSPPQRDLALTSRGTPLFPHLTLAKNLALALPRLDRKAADRRIHETAALLGLEPYLDRKPAALSAPDRRRAELARALAPQPKALLLDNPFAGLDPAARSHLRADLARIQTQLRPTIIYATNEPAEAMTLAGRLVLLRHGAVEQTGTPLEIYERPANVFTAVTLGSPGMNFIRGALKSVDGQLTFREGDGGTIDLELGRLGDRPGAGDHVGRDVLLGIRPEDCAAVPPAAPNAPDIFQTLVDLVEIRGGETLFHAQTGAHAFISRTPGLIDPKEAGRRYRFRLQADRAHLFDPTTTNRIA